MDDLLAGLRGVLVVLLACVGALGLLVLFVLAGALLGSDPHGYGLIFGVVALALLLPVGLLLWSLLALVNSRLRTRRG